MTKKTLTTLAVIAVMAGCATTKTPAPAKPGDDTALAPVIEFIPADAQADLQFLEGRYQNLFSPASSAVWVNDSVAALKRNKDRSAGMPADPQLEKDAAAITEAFVVIECSFESAFPDMSVAYEAVGLRGFDVYIELPGAKKVAAIQRVPKIPIEEEQRDALKVYRRTVLLIFPKRDFATREMLFTSSLENAKLVVNGNGSTFYFDWPTALPGAGGQPQMTIKNAARAVKMGFHDVYSAIRPVLHAFD